MHSIYNSSLCACSQDFDLLLDVAQATQTGIEVCLYFELPYVVAAQEAAYPRLVDTPITMHSPMAVDASSKPGTPEWKRLMAWWERSFAIYHQLHAHSIVMHTHQRSGFGPEETEALRGCALSNIQTIGRMAAEQGVRLTVENVGLWNNQSLLFDEEQFLRLFKELPQEVGALIDLGHALINRWNLERVVSTLGKRIFAFHLHNNDGDADTHRPLFEEGGWYKPEQVEDFLRLTNRFCPDAEWILEYASGEHINREMLKADLRRLQDINA